MPRAPSAVDEVGGAGVAGDVARRRRGGRRCGRPRATQAPASASARDDVRAEAAAGAGDRDAAALEDAGAHAVTRGAAAVARCGRASTGASLALSER